MKTRSCTSPGAAHAFRFELIIDDMSHSPTRQSALEFTVSPKLSSDEYVSFLAGTKLIIATNNRSDLSEWIAAGRELFDKFSCVVYELWQE